MLAVEQMGDNPPARTLATAVFRAIRGDILACAIMPGQRLRIAELTDRFECAGNVVREALSRLAAEGLVVSQDQRGFIVAPLSRRDLVDLTHLRIKLETLALEESIRNGDADWEELVRSATEGVVLRPHSSAPLQDRQSVEWRNVHDAFHRSLIAACGSPRLLALCRSNVEQSERFRALAFQHGKPERDVAIEHQALSAAVLARDLTTAKEALRAHYPGTSDYIFAMERESKNFIFDD